MDNFILIFLYKTIVFLVLPTCVIFSIYVGIIFLAQNQTFKELKSIDLKVVKNTSFYSIVNGKNNSTKEILKVVKNFKSFKNNKQVLSINNYFNTPFNVFYIDFWLDERLLFKSDLEENVQMEVDYILEKIAEVERLQQEKKQAQKWKKYLKKISLVKWLRRSGK